ncbi:MAG: GNAT family N-acetyltransferase [Rhodospirillales bacterium]
MEMRKARPGDVEPVMAIAEEAYAPYVAIIGRPPAPMVADFAEAEAAGQLHVLEREGEIVAYIHLYPKGDVLHIENLAVMPALRRQGIARRLLDFAEAQAAALGIGVLDLYTNEVMESAQSLYLATGFDEVERREEAGFRRVYLRKTL